MSNPIPYIYTVYEFRPVSADQYYLVMHLVVGFSSADAEKRVRDMEQHHLDEGVWFIMTDAFMTEMPRCYVMDVNRLGENGIFDEGTMNAYIKVFTTGQEIKGISYPPAFRCLSDSRKAPATTQQKSAKDLIVLGM